MSEPKDTKLVMFHCPEDVRAEMDALCEHNMIDRTEFLMQAIYRMMDSLEEQQKGKAYPEMEEEVLLAAEDDAELS